MTDRCRRRCLGMLLGACLLAGCQPAGTGSISLDPKDPAVRSLKTFADAKRPGSANDASKSARPRSRAGTNFQ
jgi:hypothetical protein